MRTWLLRSIVLLCAMLIALTAIMPGTFAWDSDQMATNSVYGSGTVKIPVELIKLEKQADGTVTDIPVPNTVFYLFHSDGTQLGGRYVTDEYGKISLILNPGSYYFEEALPATGYTYDTDALGNPVTRYPFYVGAGDEIVTVTAFNRVITGSLLIRKIVKNPDGSPLTQSQEQTLFPFIVTFSDEGTYSYWIDGGQSGTLESGDILALTHGQTAVFENLPNGLLYNVTEMAPEGYSVSSTGHRGNITQETSVAEFVNWTDAERQGSLTVSKEVTGEGADLNREFSFVVTVGGITEHFTLKDGESRTIDGLPLGAEYTVTEENAAEDGYYATVESYTGRIADTTTVRLPFVNVYIPGPESKTGSLTVTKEVLGEGADPEMAFAFTVDFIGENAPESQSFTLKNGESVTFENLPLGTTYTVTETDASAQGYHATVREYTGQIVMEDTVILPFVNVYDPEPADKAGSLTVSKSVIGESADAELEFTFSVDFAGEGAPQSETFTLKAGESKTFENIPHGVTYTVTETDAAGYEAVLDSAAGSIAGDAQAYVSFVNIVPGEEPETPTGSLTVTKEVLGENADPEKVFSFTVDFSGENAPASEAFTLKAGESRTFENIPHGVTYTVTETDAAGYKAVVETISGTVAGNQNASVTFINVVPEEYVTLTVRKLLAGGYPDADAARDFVFILIVDGKMEQFALKANEFRTFTIPAGAAYEVCEADYFHEGYSQSIVNGFGTAAGNTEVIVTNSYVGDAMLEISGVKTWELGDYTDAVLPEFITIRLMSGGLLIEEQTVTPNEEGQWAYSFTVPRYNADGTEAVYTLEEETIPGFRARYDGYNITNTYIPPTEVEIPVITKVIEGDAAPDAEFWFVLKGKNGYPMPEGAEGYTHMTAVTGEGQASFGSLVFTRPGVYSYTVYEVDRDEPGWKYDAAIYTVIYTVTEEENGLSCAYEIMRNYGNAESIVFSNHYTYIDLTETVTVSGTKTWNYGSSPEESRPEYIIVEVYADGRFVTEKIVTKADNWNYSFELPKYDADGKIIVYTVDEVDVEDYSKVISGYDITNTYIGEPDDPDDPTAPTEPDQPTDPTDPDKPTEPSKPTAPDKPTKPSAPTTPPRPGKPGDTPQTGDAFNLPLWIRLLMLSSMGLMGIMLLRKKFAYQGKYSRHR